MQSLKCFDLRLKQDIEKDIIIPMFVSERAFEIVNTVWNGEYNSTEELQECFDCTMYGEIFVELWNSWKDGKKPDADEIIKRTNATSDILNNIFSTGTADCMEEKAIMRNAYALWGMYWEGEKIEQE